MKTKILYIALGLLAIAIVYSLLGNTTNMGTNQQEQQTAHATVGKLVDMRNSYAEREAKLLVDELVKSILYIREIDRELADYGIVINNNDYLFVDIDGQTYKVGLDIVR